MKNIEIIGGGTVSHVRNHLALTAPAYGETARTINFIMNGISDIYGHGNYKVNLHLTKMASSGRSELETNQDIADLIDNLIANPETKMIIFNPALVDYEGVISKIAEGGYSNATLSGKYEERLKTSEGNRTMWISPSAKLISRIRKERKDIFLVGFKTTCGATEDDQFLTGLHLLKSSSCNLVLANDTKTRVNMIITPEQARYGVTTDRKLALDSLCMMAWERARGTFTRSTVIEGKPVSWTSEQVPEALRTVVDHCIAQGAYKPFKGSTVGHFATKVDDKTFLTSQRKTNFNNLKDIGLVKVESTGPDQVIAHGAKPSVGGQSQRIIFSEHPEMDCIVHFHCPMKPQVRMSVRHQRWYECGSHECGKNTSEGLAKTEVPGVKCVYLDKHGPNIVFNKNIDPQLVIDFIDRNFDLTQATDEIVRI